VTTGLVVVFGGVGAVVRLVVAEAVTRRWHTELPWGTAIVNLTGAAGLGFVTGIGLAGHPGTIVAGFLAGFTTYSTWMVESAASWHEGGSGRARAAIDIMGLLVAGLLVAWGGWKLGEVLAGS